MKIIFVGTVEFSKRALEKLIELNSEIAAVLTREFSDFNSDFCDLTPLCRKHDIPFKHVTDINSDDTVSYIKKLKPDIILCFGFSQMLNRAILEIPPMGVLGYHPAKLPQNRGRHPIIWALAMGYEKTASTFFFLQECADSGNILNEKEIDISYWDNARSLYDKITSVALGQIEDFLPRLKTNKFKTYPQNTAKAGYLRKRNTQDGRIDFTQSSRQIYNLVRALTTPYGGAHIDYKGDVVKVWQARETDSRDDNVNAGTVTDIKVNEIFIKCKDNIIVLEKHEFKQLPKIGDIFT